MRIFSQIIAKALTGESGGETFSRTYRNLETCPVSINYPLFLPRVYVWGEGGGMRLVLGGQVSAERVAWNEREYLVPPSYLFF